MPDESTNPVGTTQTSQNNQTTTTQSGNDFVLDFGDLGDNDVPVTEEVQVDSLSEEENSRDELNFDIDLGTTDQDSSENTEEINSETDNGVAKDVSIDTPEETINDFDISMDYEGTSEEENTTESTGPVDNAEEKIENSEETEPNEDKNVSEDEKVVDEDVVDDNEGKVSDEEIPDEDEIIPDEVLSFTMDDANSEEKVLDTEDIKLDEEGDTSEDDGAVDEEYAENNKELVEDNGKMVSDEEILDEDEIIPDEVLNFTMDDANSEEIVQDSEEKVLDEKENAKDGEEILDEDKNILESEGVVDDIVSDESESSNGERHLFQQVNEDNQDEMSFDYDYSNNNQSFQTEEDTMDKPLFIGENGTVTNEQERFNLPEVSDTAEGVTELNIEPETQKQPELGDLLSNSPIDLSKELNDTTEENIESNLGNIETSGDESETVNKSELEEVSSDNIAFEPVTEDAISEQTSNEVSSWPVLDVAAPEAVSDDTEFEPTVSVENNGFLLDTPQTELEPQKVEETAHPENVEYQQQEQQQADERSEAVNNTAAEMSASNEVSPEINISAPVELSNISSSQRENASAESENQVQSTLSLDQILDSELLSNPQYADNSKASPQNTPVSGGKGKMGLFIGVGVAALACCVAVLAFPSITSERKHGDTVDTGITTEDESYPSAPDAPTDRPNPTGEETQQTGDGETYTPDLPNVGGGGNVIVVPDEEENSGHTETGTEPVPYVWSGDGDSDDPEIEIPIIEEVDTNQILDVILSFKSQADTYYSHGEQTADNQLMKYSLRLITVCDNYKDKVNNGEGVDYESLSTFKSTANKILSKINTYLGGDEEVPVIREATIDGESYFPGKDELKEYIYNNR